MFFNTKITTAFALATSALLLPVAAQAEEKTFERDGVRYVYSAEVRNGSTVLSGTADRTPFRLVVRGKRVSGQFNNNPVEFSLRDVKNRTETVAVN